MKKQIAVAVIFFILAVVAIVYVAFPECLYRAEIARARCAAGLDRKTVTVGDHEIAYLDGGTGQTVVLLHGYGSEKDHWARFAKYLTLSYRVVVPDVPGFGESSKIESSSYDMKSQAQRIERFMDILSLEKINLVGNSMGGFIAAVVAADVPEKIASLCLMDSSGVTPPCKSEFQLAWEKGENLLLVNSPEDFDRMMALNFVEPPFIPAPLKGYLVEKSMRSSAFNRKIEMDRRSHPLDLESMLGRITAPVFIIWGDNDRILDKSAVPVFQKGLARSSAVIMENCGHAPMFERPGETAGHYLEFLQKIGAR